MQKGEIRIGTVLWLLLLVVVVIVSKEAIPVKIRSSQFEDYMIELAKFATNQTDERLQARILEKARELDLPVTKKDVQVRKSNGRVRMKAQYTIPLEFPFYTYNWKFSHSIDRPVFII